MSQPNQPVTPTPTPNPPTPNPVAPSSPAAPPSVTTATKNSAKVTKLQTEAAYQALVSGLQSNYQPTDSFTIQGQTLTRDDIIARVNVFISQVEATKAARQQWLSAVQAERAGLQSVTPLRQALHAFLQASLGKTAQGLTAFGFTPGKVAKRDVSTKATAVAKTKATRTARNTMGKVQKKAVTGDVVGINLTPLVASPPVPGTTVTTAPSHGSSPAAPSAASAASSAPASSSNASPASGGASPSPTPSSSH